jgi:hypothetical protein
MSRCYLTHPSQIPPPRAVGHDGTPQGTQVGTLFPVALSATVRDASGRAPSGALVTFAARRAEATGSFAGGNRARAPFRRARRRHGPNLTANLIAGAYSADRIGGPLDASFALSVGGSTAPVFCSLDAAPPGPAMGGRHCQQWRERLLHAMSRSSLPVCAGGSRRRSPSVRFLVVHYEVAVCSAAVASSDWRSPCRR